MSLVYRIPEVIVEGKRLGRHIHRDERDLSFPAQQAPSVQSVVHKSIGLPLNQGNIGSCTTNAVCGAINSRPNVPENAEPLTEKDAVRLYSLEQQLEGNGPYPPADDGGTGVNACKVAAAQNLLYGFTHANGLDQALRALVVRPVITGVNWYTSFDTPSSSGLVQIEPGATVRGGHEFVALEIQLGHRVVWFCNSWGPDWGVTRNGVPGMFCMTFQTWQTLLSQEGDVTVPLATQSV